MLSGSRRNSAIFLSLVAVCCSTLMTLAARGAEKSYRVRGRQVKLQEASDLVLVKSKGPKAVMDVATQAVRAQAKVLDRDTGPPVVLLAKRPATYVKVLDGVLVPKLEGLGEAHLGDVANASETIESVRTVYKSGNQHVVPLDTLTVRFKGGLNPRFLFAVASEFKLKEAGRPKFAPGLVRYNVPEGTDVFALCEKLDTKGYVQWVEPDLALQLHFNQVTLPNDLHFEDQWHMQPGDGTVQVPEAWEISRGTDRITVAVIDTGVDHRHPDLIDNLVAGRDFVDNDDMPQPDTDPTTSPHGTACAAVVAAIADNEQGVAGAAPLAKIMPIRVASRSGFTTWPDLAESIRWSAANGAKILSCSWGGSFPSNQVADAIDEVTTQGALVFVAAGNDGPEGEVGYPAQFENAIAVGAVTREQKLADFSSFLPGELVDMVAPGRDIFTADLVGADGYNAGGDDDNDESDASRDPTGNYATISGTSFACPMAAGVAALVWSTYPELTNTQLRQILEETAVEVDSDGGQWQDGYSDRYGHGQVNALAALGRAKEMAQSDSTPPAEADTSTNRPGGNAVSAPPRANTREILETLLKFRKSLGDDGRPPLPKDLADPKTIALRRGQLAELLEPQPQSYLVRGRELVLQPSESWFATALPDTGELKGPQFWQVIRGDATERQLGGIEVAARGAGRVAVVARRELLRDKSELTAFAEAGSLPAVFPVYQRGDILLVPLGTLTLRVKADAGGRAKQAILNLGEELGLELIKDEGDTLRFGLTATSKPTNVFAAASQFAKQDSVRWSEPDLASRTIDHP